MFSHAICSDKGLVRSNNQDYCLALPEIGLYILADGMGGARGGERASQLAAETVADTVKAAPRRDASVLLEAVEHANRRVRTEAGNDARLEGMGTTIVAALAMDHEIAIASVGDSRAYLYENGALRLVTEDQTWVREVGIPLGLDEESLKRHPMRHVLTMAIGVNTELTISYYMVHMQPSATLLISSDGLHGVVQQPEIERILDEDSTLDEKCHQLIRSACDAGAPDNVSVILVRAD
jgi:serine/threonine protein phosphatase PrpC